jgi:CBS domain-containing protein
MESVARFLAEVPPFSLLTDAEREAVAKKMLVEYFPKGSVILRRDLDKAEFLYIVRKGRIRITRGRSGENERLVSLCGEGDSFGITSLLENEAFIFNATSDDDTICYLLPKAEFKRLYDTHQKVADYFSPTLSVSLANAYQIERERLSIQRHTGDYSLLFQSVASLIKRRPVVGTPDLTVREAAEIMTLDRVGSLVILGDDGKPDGIITDSDFRSKIVARNQSINIPVSAVMSSPVITIDSDDSIMNALMLMTRKRIHHLCVIERKGETERFLGVISEHDLMLMHGVSPAAAVKNIDREETVEGLLSVRLQMDAVIDSLIAQGMTAKRLTHIITSFNDKLTERILHFAEARMEKEGFGKPPVPFAWIAFGSEGREEQTITTDQDNGLVFEDTASHSDVQSYFLKFASFVVEDLDKVGFPKCKGNIMATNPELCQSLSGWKKNFSKWVHSANPKSLLNASIFFDFRALYGESSLVESLREHLFSEIATAKQFLFFMTQNALQTKPPLGFFGAFLLEDSGAHKNQLNIKERAMRPLVDGARLLSFQTKCKSANTWSRLDLAKEKALLRTNVLDNVIEAFDFMMTLRLTHHSEQRRKGLSPDNFIAPERLTQIERNALKESFRVVEEFQAELRDKFAGGIAITMS